MKLVPRSSRLFGSSSSTMVVTVAFTTAIWSILFSFDSMSAILVHAQSATSTDAPTTAPQPNDCDQLQLGDYVFLLVSSFDPFDEVSFFGFENLPGNLSLYLTDNAWTGGDADGGGSSAFATNEGVLELKTPPEGIPAGTTVGVGPNEQTYLFGRDWVTVQGSFSLTPDGEQVFLYCLSSNQQPRPLAAISYNGP